MSQQGQPHPVTPSGPQAAKPDRSPRLLYEEPGWIELARDAVVVSGVDAESYLQGQLSQDVAALATGTAAASLLLSPQGKVDAVVRVVRLGEERFVVDVDAGFGPAVIERLLRFKIRVRADVVAVAPGSWRCIALRGTGAHRAAGLGGDGGARPPAETAPARPGEGGELVDHLVVANDWPGLEGVDILGAAPRVPVGPGRVEPVAFEVRRVEAGIARMGAEIDARTIPAEAGLVDPAVSFTKGCYTGQELVARIDSRGGNVARHLRGLVVTATGGSRAPEVADGIFLGDRQVGEVTSVATSIRLGACVGLAYVHRSVAPPATVTVRPTGATEPGSEAEVRTLPLIP